MDNDFYTGEFEQLLKEKTDLFRMFPSKRVWHSIYNNLHPSRRWPSVIMSLLLMSSLSFIGYLNTGGNNSNGHTTLAITKNPNAINNQETAENKNIFFSARKTQKQTIVNYNTSFADVITNETDFLTYTIVKNNRPNYIYNTTAVKEFAKLVSNKNTEQNSSKNFEQAVDTYIKSNKNFADIAVTNKRQYAKNKKRRSQIINSNELSTVNIESSLITTTDKIVSTKVENSNFDLNDISKEDKNTIAKIDIIEDKYRLKNDEKVWIENYALQNKLAGKKWKQHLAFQIYVTPAVNYRKLTTESRGSTTAFATADINNVISQKPGFGIEAGASINYAFANRMQLKTGLQLNYTNYNIDADQTNHPIITTILLNDPNTGYSYSAARTSTTSNVFNSGALQPVTLHNRTYQISLPIALAYKLSSENNVDWFVGISAQPTYVFGGNAHLISTDLKSYVSDPSSISTWNLNFGFETYMNFKMRSYNLQVGPQVRYQVYSTYRKYLALIEKPYAVGLKFGLTKGF